MKVRTEFPRGNTKYYSTSCIQCTTIPYDMHICYMQLLTQKLLAAQMVKCNWWEVMTVMRGGWKCVSIEPGELCVAMSLTPVMLQLPVKA